MEKEKEKELWTKVSGYAFFFDTHEPVATNLQNLGNDCYIGGISYIPKAGYRKERDGEEPGLYIRNDKLEEFYQKRRRDRDRLISIINEKVEE